MRPLWAAPGFFLLLFLLPVPASGRAAPKDGAGTDRIPEPPQQDEPRGDAAAVLNPLQPGEGGLRVLQDYLKSVGQADEAGSPLTREQALLLLFALHDYDKSGRLDGLEFMQLLSDLAAQQAKGQPTSEAVEWMVDRILETQDRNRDGLLEPPELLLAPHQPQHPEFPAGPSKGDKEVAEDEGTVLWAEAPRPGEESIGHPAQPSQQGPAPPAPETVIEQGMVAPPPPSPLPEQHQGGHGREAEPRGA